jgi:hypothetical protein
VSVLVRCDWCGVDIDERKQEITVRKGRGADLDFESWECVALYANERAQEAGAQPRRTAKE